MQKDEKYPNENNLNNRRLVQEIYLLQNIELIKGKMLQNSSFNFKLIAKHLDATLQIEE